MTFFSKNKYYHLVASLPELYFNKACPIEMEDYFLQIEHELSPADQELIWYLRYYIDIDNILKLSSRWTNGGLFSQEEVKNREENKDLFPTFIYNYLKRTASSDSSSMLNQKLLLEEYFVAGLQFENEYLTRWINNERALRNSLYCIEKGDNIDTLKSHLIEGGFELESLLKGRDGIRELGNDWLSMHDIQLSYRLQNIVDRERNMDKLRWDFINEQLKFEYFTVDALIGYTVKLLILNRWSKLQKQQGRKLLDRNVDLMIEKYMHNYFE